MRKTDRRVQRTQELLQKTLIELIQEHEYDEITIQDIVDRANLGRTTFYLHYNSKDDLFTNCHKAMINAFDSRILYSLSRKELLSPETPHGMTAAYKHLQDGRTHLYPIFQNRESLRKMRDWNAQYIETMLRTDFIESDSLIPFDVLANYLAGAQLTLLQWWLEKRRPYTPEKLAETLHLLQRAAIRDAFES
ncbi:MAG: TetR/AcrR family transcriptional regulator [Anaerolineales bacterium]|nr:TetR/AcrR family transcriptional regulator [Anaerolineales bacterium]